MRQVSIFLLSGAICLAASAARAQVRTEDNPGAYISPPTTSVAQMLFGADGYYRIAGGVVLGGHAEFLLEQGGVDTPLAPGAVTAVAEEGGGLGLRYEGRVYDVRSQPGLACPLARFVGRGGQIAYTVPKFMDQDSQTAMLNAGLRHHRIAREFDRTAFETLLHAADFAHTTALPMRLSHTLVATINDDTGLSGYALHASDTLAQMVGSILNTDDQVRYHVFLEPATGRVEISGVPLRYYWAYDNGAAGVFAVEAFAQDWAPGTGLTDVSAKGAKPTQYDVVNFYQVAGVLNQLRESDRGLFGTFVAGVCGS